MNDRFYDVVDSEGNVVETAEQQQAEAAATNIDLSPEAIKAMAKKWNRENVTCKLPRVIGEKGCGHRLDLSHQPRHRNCEQCLFAWFNAHGEIVQQLDEMHNNGNDKMIIELQGKKFLHRFLQFMSTIAQWKLQQQTLQAQQEKNEQTSSISVGVDYGCNTGDTTGVQVIA